MRYHLSEIPALLRTPAGRKQIWGGLHYRSWPVLSRLAALHRRTLMRQTRVAAVVGSFGKSTTTRAIAAALGVRLHRRFSYNCFSGLAHSVLRIPPGQRHGVIEVGIDRPGQMSQYARIVRPDIVVVTCIGSEHHRSLGTLETTRTEKAEMVRALSSNGLAVLNGDDPNVLWMKSQTSARTVTFGFGADNDVRADDVRLDWPHGTRFQLHVDGQTREMTVRLLGQHMLLPILAAVAVARAEGLPLDAILPPLQELAPTRGRLETIALPNDIWIVRDDDKSALETIHSALDVFAQIPAKRRLIALGEVSEPPSSQGPLYQAIGERLARIVSLVVMIGTDKNRRSYMTGVERGGLNRSAVLYASHSVLRAAELLRAQLQPGDVLLIKGRYEQHLERIALSLMGRNVLCDIKLCRIKRSTCADCPMLERGWQDHHPVT